ncbi:MAG: hypothetical protein M8844_10700 [marine benthic group bacterium]|nr:hypothetical protein [Gemmatimonadota bacterium]
MDDLNRLTAKDDVDQIRAQLQKILDHPEFQATERLRDFLRFVVEETLAGRSAGLKGYTVATRVFGRNESFDPSSDPIVRIEAGRLRRVLERYYLVAGERDPIRIDIPKGRYVPRFTRHAQPRTRATDRPVIDPERLPLPEDGPTIAVLPFRDLTGDPERAFFLSGLVEELVNEVNHYESVIAIPCQQAEVGVDGGRIIAPPVEPGEARFILGGSVRRDDEELKIAAQLTDTATVRQIWGESYRVTLEPGQMLAAQEELAQDMMAAIADEYGVIAQRLTRESIQVPPSELGTYDALLRYHHYMLLMTPEAYEEAFEALSEATRAEPQYGPTWSALANLHAHAYVFDLPRSDGELPIAIDYARRGATLDPGSQLARTILSYVYLLNGDFDHSRSEAEVALGLNPNSPNYVGTIGYILVFGGEFDRGEQLLRQAQARNPCHPRWFHHALFHVHFGRGEYEQALYEAEVVGHPIAYYDPVLKAAALGMLGRSAEAADTVELILQLKPDIESRAHELLVRTATPMVVRDTLIEGLRSAGLRIDDSNA